MLLSRPTRWGIIFIYIHELPRIWNMYNDLLRVDRLATAIFMLITLAYPKYCRCLFMSIVVHLLSSVWSIHNFSRRTSLSSQNPSKWRPVRCLIRLNDEREQGIDLTSKKKAQSNKLAKSLTKQNKKKLMRNSARIVHPSAPPSSSAFTFGDVQLHAFCSVAGFTQKHFLSCMDINIFSLVPVKSLYAAACPRFSSSCLDVWQMATCWCWNA